MGLRVCRSSSGFLGLRFFLLLFVVVRDMILLLGRLLGWDGSVIHGGGRGGPRRAPKAVLGPIPPSPLVHHSLLLLTAGFLLDLSVVNVILPSTTIEKQRPQAAAPSWQGVNIPLFRPREAPPESPSPSCVASSSSSRGFDIADVLEQGYARDTCAEYLRPFRRGSKMFRFYVSRSDDRTEYSLYTDDQDGFVMHARFLSDKKVHFVPYHPEDKLFNIDTPAFVMTASRDQSEWTLTNPECEACYYRGVSRRCTGSQRSDNQQIVHCSHKVSSIGEGIFNSMEVAIPGLYTDGARVIWCPKEGYPRLGAPLPDGSHHPHAIRLKTKEPHWNEEIESLVLDFKGRMIQPSAKNFQLTLVKKPDYIILQYGKVTSNVFILDFRYPLSIVQAFAIALTTFSWK
ncbi:unnamed protein product [Vitrella brassicaformis CCMP3155]|uniref:Tubby C-terminal domain-containing protein n=1 Tax=Vitrella brassicaformis (strain CCMP3155) TaxID=1169540 RepID=A0A0G4EIJ7_VITBC|nr:unnamed protein product [Vitrella brassicaformis CCMP3155]|eukprot:CEL96579.1 unnamed protein product [Vitrella brassicaformis CCMP3155]